MSWTRINQTFPSYSLAIWKPLLPYNVRDQRRRAVGAPLADRNFLEPHARNAGGVTTRDDRCIA
jgi:hypothetical protein